MKPSGKRRRERHLEELAEENLHLLRSQLPKA
jgi:hypothetical protein